jgi:hypothetical protein
LRPGGTLIEARPSPQLARDLDRVDAGLLPPRPLIADPVNLAVMRPAQGRDEFIADLAAQRTRLHEAQVMRVRWRSPTHQTRLLHHSCRKTGEFSEELVAQLGRRAPTNQALLTRRFMQLASFGQFENLRDLNGWTLVYCRSSVCFLRRRRWCNRLFNDSIEPKKQHSIGQDIVVPCELVKSILQRPELFESEQQPNSDEAGERSAAQLEHDFSPDPPAPEVPYTSVMRRQEVITADGIAFTTTALYQSHIVRDFHRLWRVIFS